MKRTALLRKTPLRPKTYAEWRAKGSGKPRETEPRATLGAGRKTKEWQAVWRELKPRFERAGIVHCELRGTRCTDRLYLTPAHSLKRRNANTPELLREVIIACAHCHSVIELMKECDMAAIVRATIAARVHPV